MWRAGDGRAFALSRRLPFPFAVITAVATLERMTLELKLRKIGNSVGVVLPKEALAFLNAAEGDTLCATEAADGTLRVAAMKPEGARQLEKAQDIMRRYRNTLLELAK